MIFSAATVIGLQACMDSSSSKTNHGAQTPSLSTVVDGDYIGAYPSLTVAPDGRLHASYYAKFDWGQPGGGALRHAVRENGAWSVETLDGSVYNTDLDVGQFSDIASDSQGGIHIVYWDATHQDLKYAYLPAGSVNGWQIETVADMNEVCQDSDIKLDSSGKVYVGYCGSGQILLASRNGSSWSSEPVASVGDDARSKVGLRFDSGGNLHVVFFDAVEKKLKYRVKELAAGWQAVEEVTDSPLGNSEMRMAFMLDGAQKPNIVFYDIAQQKLMHSVKTGSGWVTSFVTDVGDILYNTSDAISGSVGYLSPSGLTDHLGRIHAMYFDGNNQDLMHAVLSQGVWTIDTVDEAGDVGRTSAVAEDSLGTIHVIYRDTTNNDLKYAYFQ